MHVIVEEAHSVARLVGNKWTVISVNTLPWLCDMWEATKPAILPRTWACLKALMARACPSGAF